MRIDEMERGPGELLLFEGLEPEEPSARVDEAILAFARARLRSGRRRRRMLVFLRAALAASLLAGAALALRSWVGPAPEAGDRLTARGAIPAEAGSIPEPFAEIAELKAEVSAIGEMAELISEDRREEREEISARVRECLASLEELERKIGRVDTSFFWETASNRKEANA